MKYLVFMLGLVGLWQAGYADVGLKSKPEPKMLRQVTYTYFEDGDLTNEACPEFLVMKTDNGSGVSKSHKLCGGVYPASVISRDGEVIFIQMKGGNGRGWAMYRYKVDADQLDFYSFNYDPREFALSEQDENGIWLDVGFSQYDLKKGGYKPDRHERWYWALDSKVPVKK